MRPKRIVITEVTETEKLIDYVNRHGLKAAAEKYGASSTTLGRWLRVQGYELIRQWRKAGLSR